MTAEEAQDQAAKEWDEAFDYRTLRSGVQVGTIKMLHLDGVNKRALELYAKSKWDEACEAQKKYIAEWIRPHESDALCDEIYKSPAPEFKP